MMLSKPIKVIKVGDNQFEQAGFLDVLAKVFKQQQLGHSCILVHGGGRAVDEHLEKLHIKPHFVDGQRVTDAQTLQVAEMVLSGKINKDIVDALNRIGLDALGISGVDRNLLQVVPWDGRMGLVGRIIHVRAGVLTDLCAQDAIPVLSPISSGDGGKYNVNADHAAAMIAGALQAPELVLVSDIPGVVIQGELCMRLSYRELKRYIDTREIRDGMIPKVNACMDALENGALQARITNLDGLAAGTGTRIINN